MERNNGKIAIAIVAMFVVALSIVGVTYAYFTATVNTNTGDNSATITAGALTATWTGNGASLTAFNAVPGWKSDNSSFYDPSYAYPSGHISACSTLDDEFTDLYTECNEDNATDSYGIVNPISFTVNNTSADDSVYYAITLQTTDLSSEVRSSGQLETTRGFLKATLYQGTFDATEENYGGTKIGTTTTEALTIAKEGNKIILAEHIELTKAKATENYFIIVEYVDNSGVQNDGQNISFTVKADIVGVAQNTQDGKWYDAAGKDITTYDDEVAAG